MRRKRRRKFKKPDLKLNPKLVWISSFLLFTAIVLGALGLAAYKSEVFIVRDGSIKSNVELNGSLKLKLKNKSLFSLNLKELSSVILREHPEFKEVYVIKKFPSTVAIEVTKRIPFAQIKRKLFYPVDKEAVVLSSGEKEPNKGLITVEINSYKNLLRKGKRIDDDRLQYAFKLIKALKEEKIVGGFKVAKINANNIQAIYFFMNLAGSEEQNPLEIKVIIGQRDFRRRLNLLKSIVNKKLKDKLSLTEYIDLRYKEAYVGFKR